MDNNNQSSQQVVGKQSGEDKFKELVLKFKALPKNAQIAVGGIALFFVYMIFGGSDTPTPRAAQQPVAQIASGNVKISAGQTGNAGTNKGVFEAVDPSRESLQRGFYTQQRKEIADLKSSLINNVKVELSNVTAIKDAVTEQQQQMQQIIATFNDQIQSFEKSNQEQRTEINRLVEEARVQEEQGRRGQALNSGISGGAGIIKKLKKRRISQTTLRAGGGVGMNANPNQALLSFDGIPGSAAVKNFYIEKISQPFLPPLGFIKGTLLNGFDALVGGAVPSLVRLSGSYKTAMNSTVSLDGCIALVEFEGEISTERAIGKPSRMTCVYPDRGAVTYQLSGYVVDANDGIVGIPGIFYEGDASRIAAALMADFAAGMSTVVTSNEFTQSTSTGGTASNLTGSALKSEVASGVTGMMGSLRDYLEERSSRVVPFVRIDPTRDIHIVIMSGIELRNEGSAWTLLVDGKKADQVRAQNDAARRKAEATLNKQNQRL